jgi:hypothetical protein
LTKFKKQCMTLPKSWKNRWIHIILLSRLFYQRAVKL